MGEISPEHNYSDAKLRLIKEFISKNRHAEDKYGVLIAAVVSNQNDVVKYLLQSNEFCHDKGLDGVHHRTIGYSLMTISTSWQTLTLMEILMDIGGLNPNNSDELGVVPMHAVTGLKYVPFALEKLVLLLRSGARTGTVGSDGRTVMDIFIHRGQYHGAAILHEIGWETKKSFIWSEPPSKPEKEHKITDANLLPSVTNGWELETTKLHTLELARDIDREPMSLFKQCRKSTLEHLGTRVRSKVKHLLLPSFIKSSLSLPELDEYLVDFERYSVDNISEMFPYVAPPTSDENGVGIF